MIKSELHTLNLPFPDKGDRRVWVYVPEHGENEKLPVIYMTDGQNLFDEKATPYGSWGVNEAIENERKNGFTGVIAVGIDNGNEYRDSELTPKCVGEIQYRELFNDIFTPQGEIFDDFLMNTVVPYVEKNFPVRAERKYRAVCGSSSGGLQVFFEGIENSGFFNCIGAFSPAFPCYTQEDWKRYLLDKMKDDMPYLYLYCGSGDALEEELFKGTEMMYDLLPEIGYPYDMMNEVLLFENKHNEKAWREIFPDFLRTFLSRTV